jgi:hypothetical protein
MAFVIKLLGTGATNAGSLSVPYSVSSPALGAIVHNLRFTNAGASAVTVNLFFKPSGGSQIRILDKDKSVAASTTLVVKPELTMGASDAIEVTTSAAMDYVVCGLENQ